MFQSINKISNMEDKRIFKSIISLYIDIIRCFAIRDQVKLKQKTDLSAVLVEIIKLGIIESNDDLQALQKILGRQYNDFIQAVNLKINFFDFDEYLVKFNRRKIIKNTAEKRELRIVDLFCGAGGLSLGFCQEGFSVLLANDKERTCIETYKFNHPELSETNLLNRDIREVIDGFNENIKEEIDVLIGGPPCQGFSHANQQKIIDDPRNKLYGYFIKAVEKIAPKFVLMENVSGMMKVANQVINDYHCINAIKDGMHYTYSASYKQLNSHLFSVAQSRERLFFIAVRNDIVEQKKVTPQTIFTDLITNNKNNKIYNLIDALSFIRPLTAAQNKGVSEAMESGKNVEINSFIESNSYLNLINSEKIFPLVFNHKARYCNENNLEIYRRMEQGNNATDPKIADIMPYAHRNNVFKDKYYKLIANKPSRTITAHLRMDGHSHIHPVQIRSITPREAARIQSFPDDYVFIGTPLETFMQIGNAVPPVVARAFAKEIKKYL